FDDGKGRRQPASLQSLLVWRRGRQRSPGRRRHRESGVLAQRCHHTVGRCSKRSNLGNGGGTSVTSMSSTSAVGTSSRIQAHICATWCGVPCNIASTESSIRLRTHPATPSARACCTQA